MGQRLEETLVVVRGGGDLATGVIQKLYRAGFKVVILETAIPLAIRRTVALCTAVYQGRFKVEDVEAVCISNLSQCRKIWNANQVPLVIDPEGKSIEMLHPTIVVDAILAKKNLGTKKEMASIVIALGPGFSAPNEVDIVIETMRGHQLGRLYFEGTALPNTGIPGEIGGKSAERVVHSLTAGKVKHIREIGATVKKDDLLFYVNQVEVRSPLDGVLRGLITDGIEITKGLKCADIDPRSAELVDCYTISDKARALGGAVLEGILYVGRQKDLF